MRCSGKSVDDVSELIGRVGTVENLEVNNGFLPKAFWQGKYSGQKPQEQVGGLYLHK